ncbi:MAG: DNA-directed RNA polymerase subunit H [Candidatus Woesearchaeota archaeon]
MAKDPKTKPEYNVAKHVLVPKHRRLNDKEKEQLFKSFDIREAELPKIYSKDPAIADMKLKAGEVVQITRKSPTAGEAYYYRCVVHG